MRFLAGFGLVLVTIALVQSKPTISQLDDLNAAIDSLPSDLVNELSNVADQVSTVLSPAQLRSLEQQASELAENVLNGVLDVKTAVNQLLQQLQQYLGSNSPLLTNVQPLVQELVNAVQTVLSQLPSNLRKRRATVAGTDLSALANQLQPNGLDGLLAGLPQDSDLLNQLGNVAAQVSSILSPAQLQSLQQKAYELAQQVSNGNLAADTAIYQLLQQLQQYLGPNSQLSDVSLLVQQLINAIQAASPQLPKNLRKRRATVAGTDPLAL
jgi:oligoendopeptidase F